MTPYAPVMWATSHVEVLTFPHGGVCKGDVGLYPGHRSGSLNSEEGDLENLGKHSLGWS